MNREKKVKLLLRTFFIQGGWNFERFQNIGLLFVLDNCLKKFHGTGKNRTEAFLRHMGVFNTQPHMAGFVVGNICGLEEALSSEKDEDSKRKIVSVILEIKKTLASTFASIGDRLIWGRFYPFTTILTLFILTCAGNYSWAGLEKESAHFGLAAAAAPFSVLLFSAFAVYLRWKGISYGYQCSGGASCGLDMLEWNSLMKKLSIAGFYMIAFVLFFMLFNLVHKTLNAAAGENAFKIVLAAASFFLHFIVLKVMKRNFYYSLLAVAAFSLAVSVMSLFFGVDVSW